VDLLHGKALAADGLDLRLSQRRTTVIRRILVGLDGSALAETILLDVQVLAERVRADLVLLHVTHVPEGVRAAGSPVAIEEVLAQEQAKARTYLEQVGHRLTAAGLTVHTALLVGETATEIVRYAERERIDLIALATHGRSGMRRWVHGSVADAVIHSTTTPLLLLQPASEGTAAPLGSGRIVVPLDGSSAAEAALPLAEELGRALAVPMVLVQAVDIIGLAFVGDPLTGSYSDYSAVLDVLRAEAERYLEGVAKVLRGEGVQATTEVPLGSPAEEIAARVRQHPGSLTVMSTHGRTGWRAMVLGSVTRRVSLQASGPVLVVPSPELRG
jgi:nucleotide-binding universal stress UspA family protein